MPLYKVDVKPGLHPYGWQDSKVIAVSDPSPDRNMVLIETTQLRADQIGQLPEVFAITPPLIDEAFPSMGGRSITIKGGKIIDDI